MARLRLFASARQVAGTASQDIPGRTVDEVLQGAVLRFGGDFAKVLGTCRVWLNGEVERVEEGVSGGGSSKRRGQ